MPQVKFEDPSLENEEMLGEYALKIKEVDMAVFSPAPSSAPTSAPEIPTRVDRSTYFKIFELAKEFHRHNDLCLQLAASIRQDFPDVDDYLTMSEMVKTVTS